MLKSIILFIGMFGGTLAQPVAASQSAKGPAQNPPISQEVIALYNSAVEALQKSDPKEAIRLLKKCVSKNPQGCACYRALGIAHSHPKIEHARAAIGYLQAYLDKCPEAPDAEQFYQILASQPPRTPKDLARCNPDDLIALATPLPRRIGEAIRYHVDVNGLSVGVVDVKIERLGQFETQPVIEYRAAFDVDHLVSTFMALSGRAAALIPTGGQVPIYAMNRYQSRGYDVREELRFESDDNRNRVTSERRRRKTDNGDAKPRISRRHRRYPTPVVDFLTAFYGVRALPRDVKGCATIFNSGIAMTLWIEADGQEKIKTPAGLKLADRYLLKYATERSRQARHAKIWLSQGPERLPYQATVFGNDTVEVKIHMYEPGSKQ